MTTLSTLLGDIDRFLTDLAAGLNAQGLPNTLGPMDHICYRAASNADYLQQRSLLTRFGLTLVEGMIGGRPITTIQLYQPLSSPFGDIPCIELAAPKPGKVHLTGLEHGEIVVNSLVELINNYPNVAFNQQGLNATSPEVTLTIAPYQVKFHEQSLADTIATEMMHDQVIPVPKGYFD